MRIVYDARTVRRHMTGVGIYTRSLLRGLMRIDTENEYICLMLDVDQWKSLDAPDNFRLQRVDADYESHPGGEWWEHVTLPGALRRWGADVIHGPAFGVPWRGDCPSVVTVHDLVAFAHPETFPLKFRHYMKWLTRGSVRHATRVVAVSENTRRDLINYCKSPDEKIKVVYEAAGEQFEPAPPEDVERFRGEYSLPDEYILFVGTIEPRKGLKTLLEAYRLLRKERGIEIPLVVVGRYGWKSDELRGLLDRACRELDVYHIDYIDLRTLPFLYAGATVFAYPSLYEGFGLPPLEAMACETPVVASECASIPEVVGDAGVLCEPGDVKGWADALERCVNDREWRRELIEKGRARAKRFSWERAAVETLAVYKEAVES